MPIKGTGSESRFNLWRLKTYKNQTLTPKTYDTHRAAWAKAGYPSGRVASAATAPPPPQKMLTKAREYAGQSSRALADRKRQTQALSGE